MKSVEIIAELGLEPVKPYKIDDKFIDRNFELKHGKSLKWFSMDKVSNAEFPEVGLLFPLPSVSRECLSITTHRKSLSDFR